MKRHVLPGYIAETLPGWAGLDPAPDRRGAQLAQLAGAVELALATARARSRAAWDEGLGGDRESFLHGKRSRLREQLGIAQDPLHLDSRGGRGLLRVLHPAGYDMSGLSHNTGTAVACVIVPDPDDPAPAITFASAAVMRGVWVVVPALVPRAVLDAVCTRSGKDARHVLHRLLYPLGRSIVGLEASTISGFVRAAQEKADRVAVVAFGDSGRAAIAAAAIEAPDLLVLLGAFDRPGPERNGPADLAIHDAASLGTDAEFLALFASTPVLVTPERHGAIRRARAVRTRIPGAAPIGTLPGDPSPEFVLAALGDHLGHPDAGIVNAGRSVDGETMAALGRATFATWYRAARSEIASRDLARREALAEDASRPARARAERTAAVRRVVGCDAIETLIPRQAPVTLRSRLLRVTEAFVAYECLVGDGFLDAWFQLLVPRSIAGRAPVVVCQHGLDGQPNDVTGLDPGADPVYHAYGAALAERGYVVMAPYLAVPAPQAEAINPLVHAAAAIGATRAGFELVRLRRALDAVLTLPFAGERVGYYGLSYGGHTGLWLTPLEPRIAALVVSGHFNDWMRKTTDDRDSRSFLAHPDEDFTQWNGSVLGHPDLLIASGRPALVEAGSNDPITTDRWLAGAWREVTDWAVQAAEAPRYHLARFEGIHEISGAESLPFLDRWLRSASPASATYVYRPAAGRALPGIMDSSPDSRPYLTRRVPSGTVATVRLWVGDSGSFRGIAFRASAEGTVDHIEVSYRVSGQVVGSVQLSGDRIHPLWDLWHEAAIGLVDAPGWVEVHLAVAGAPDAAVHLYCPRSLGGTPHPDALVPAWRALGALGPQHESTHEFARELLSSDRRERAVPVSESLPPGWARLTPMSIVELGPKWAVVDGGPGTTALRWIRDILGRLPHGPDGPGAAVQLQLERPRRTRSSVASRDESFRADVQANRVSIVARSERGLLRGATWLEDRIRETRVAGLEPGAWVFDEAVGVRITTGVLPAGDRYSEASRPSAYTDPYLERIARAGFNGLWTWLNIEEVSRASGIFAELDARDGPRRLAALESLAQRASQYGIDVYPYLASNYAQPIPAAFFARHPELRGQGWLAPPLCTSDERVLAYHRECVGAILERAPSVAGFVVIFDIEGFTTCGSEEAFRLACPRCRERSPDAIAREVLVNLADALRDHGPQRRLVAWSYGDRPDWVARVFADLPREIVGQVDFSKGVPVTRDDVTEPAGDYTLAELGPSPRYSALREAARSAGRPWIAKTEHAISQEAIFVPYLPGLDRLVERAAAVRASDPGGWFANWDHYGFLVPLPAEALNAFAFDPPPEPEQLLDRLARQRFGPAALPMVRKAWAAFSAGLASFPYSDPVARNPGPIQKGPTQPLCLDPTRPGGGAWRAWQNDTTWTQPWGRERARRWLTRSRDAFRVGLDMLVAAEPFTTGPDLTRLEDDVRIARILVASMESTLAQLDWHDARDELVSAASTGHRATAHLRLRSIAVRQRERALAILPILERDSRLGFAQDGGGVVRGGLFTPELLRQSIGELDDLLARQLPAPIPDVPFLFGANTFATAVRADPD